MMSRMLGRRDFPKNLAKWATSAGVYTANPVDVGLGVGWRRGIVSYKLGQIAAVDVPVLGIAEVALPYRGVGTDPEKGHY